jgi:glutamine synthetase
LQRKRAIFAMLVSSTAALRRATTTTGVRAFASLEQFRDYGKSVFTGKVADDYLAKHGSSGAILKDPLWVKNHADTVANAVFDWYVE